MIKRIQELEVLVGYNQGWLANLIEPALIFPLRGKINSIDKSSLVPVYYDGDTMAARLIYASQKALPANPLCNSVIPSDPPAIFGGESRDLIC